MGGSDDRKDWVAPDAPEAAPEVPQTMVAGPCNADQMAAEHIAAAIVTAVNLAPRTPTAEAIAELILTLRPPSWRCMCQQPLPAAQPQAGSMPAAIAASLIGKGRQDGRRELAQTVIRLLIESERLNDLPPAMIGAPPPRVRRDNPDLGPWRAVAEEYAYKVRAADKPTPINRLPELATGWDESRPKW